MLYTLVDNMAAQRLYRLELEDPKDNVFVTQLGGDNR